MAEAKTPEHESPADETVEEAPSNTPAKKKGSKRAPAKKKQSKPAPSVPWWQNLSHRRKSHLRAKK